MDNTLPLFWALGEFFFPWAQFIYIFDVFKHERQYGVWQNLFFQYVQDGGDEKTNITRETKCEKGAECIYKMLLYRKTIFIGLQLVVEVVRHSFAWRDSFRIFQEFENNF